MKELFQRNNIKSYEVTIPFGNEIFHIDHQNKQIYAEHAPLLFATMTSICCQCNLEPLLQRNDNFSLLQKLIIDSMPLNQSKFYFNYQSQRQTIEICHKQKTLRFVDMPALIDHVQKLCHENNIPWRKDKQQLKELGTKVIEKTKK